MKTKYRHIHFKEINTENGLWSICNNKTGALLGEVFYYKQWKKSVVELLPRAVFDEKCLLDIADFLKQLNKPSAREKGE